MTALAAASIASECARAADVNEEAECGSPCLEYSGYAEIFSDWQFLSGADRGTGHQIYPKAELELTGTLVDGFSVLTNIVTEPVVDYERSSRSYFSDVGTYVEVLQAQFAYGPLEVYAGKIHPIFGRAWDITPGLHGIDLAEDYELSERLGGGASLTFDALSMSNALSVSAFTTDRTVLSESLFTNRGRLGLDDGGAGNTKGVSSVAVAIDGCRKAEVDKCYEDGDFGYQLAARYQEGGPDSDGNETGVLLSLNKSFVIDEDAKILLFGEAAWFNHFDGEADDALAVTGSGALQSGTLLYSVAYTQIRTLISGASDESEQLFDASISYDLGTFVSGFGEHWSLGAGYSFDRFEDDDAHVIGLRLRTDFEGAVSGGD